MVVGGCWLLVVGCWLVVVGCWLVVVGKFSGKMVGKKGNPKTGIIVVILIISLGKEG